MIDITIVMPTLNEASGVLDTVKALQRFRQQGVELIVVDGGSTDSTVELVKPWVDQVMTSSPGRAMQMNAGAQASTGEVLLFLHADTELPPDGLQQLFQVLQQGAMWGRFDVRLVGKPAMLSVISIMMNARSRLTGIATGDQAMFVRRTVFDAMGGFPNQVLMEDIALSNLLIKQYRPACLVGPVLSSGRRWEAKGVWRTIFLMWRLRWLYWRGVSPEQLKDMYK